MIEEVRQIEDHEIWDEFWNAGACSGSIARDCQHGITWFAPEDRGCFDDGELDDLLRKAEAEPEKYKAVYDSSSVHFTTFMGKEWCWSCQQCRAEALRYQTVVWNYRFSISEFLNRRMASEFERVRKEIVEMAGIGGPPQAWREINTAPKSATNVQVLMRDGTHHTCAHWAEDLSGEEQPPFKGWFVPSGNGMRQIEEPMFWRPRQ